MEREDGGPAFPLALSLYEANFGMSLRDYFAAAAMTGMLANKYTTPGSPHGGAGTAEGIPAAAYRCADAMLAERAK